jgi:hypothetical protein
MLVKVTTIKHDLASQKFVNSGHDSNHILYPISGC